MIFIHRRIGGRVRRAEGKAKGGFTRGPHDTLDASADRGIENVIGRDHVVAERQVFRHQIRRGNRGEMHNRIGRGELSERVVFAAGPLKRVHYLPTVVQIDLVERANRIGRRLDVDVEHVVSVFNEIPADCVPGFAASACDDDVLHFDLLLMT